MKAFFGMTAAVLLVVTMLVVALPGTGLAAGKECDPLLGQTKSGEPVLLTKGACIGGMRYNEYTCTVHYCNKNGTWGQAIRVPPVYWQYQECCNNGESRIVKLDEFKIEKCRRWQKVQTQRCVNSQWKNTDSFAWFGAGYAPDGTACTINNCPGTCQNGVCQPQNAAAAMAGNGGVCGCSVCTECQTCRGNTCVPIENASPSNPECLTQ